MKKNNHITALLPAYLDHQLDETQQKTVEVHIATCPACTKELKELEILLNAF